MTLRISTLHIMKQHNDAQHDETEHNATYHFKMQQKPNINAASDYDVPTLTNVMLSVINKLIR